jgi:hypothetical protein
MSFNGNGVFLINTLGQRAVPASVYAGFLSNPDLLRQIGQ